MKYLTKCIRETTECHKIVTVVSFQKGKCIIFVANIDRCYRLKLFLEQFGIRTCVLNSELPVNSRIHIVEEFNKGVYDIIIASDENEVLGDEDQTNGESAEGGAEGASADGAKTEDAAAKSRPRKKRRTVGSKDYGVSRGIDFKNVAW